MFPNCRVVTCDGRYRLAVQAVEVHPEFPVLDSGIFAIGAVSGHSCDLPVDIVFATVDHRHRRHGKASATTVTARAPVRVYYSNVTPNEFYEVVLLALKITAEGISLALLSPVRSTLISICVELSELMVIDSVLPTIEDPSFSIKSNGGARPEPP